MSRSASSARQVKRDVIFCLLENVELFYTSSQTQYYVPLPSDVLENMKFPVFKSKPKNTDFLVIEIGLERIACGIFKDEEGVPKLSGIGRKKYSSREEIFNSTLEALDALSAISEKIPQNGVLGVSGGSLQTTTTIAHYTRPKPNNPITVKETEHVIKEVVERLETTEKKILFSSIASAKIDGAKVTNPVGLKGKEVEFSCFVAFVDGSELELFNRIVDEIEFKVKKIVPTSFAVVKVLETKNVENALLIRCGENKSELTIISEGQIAEIFPVDLGIADKQFLKFSWEAALKNIEKKNLLSLVWVFGDHEEANLEEMKQELEKFPWRETIGVEKPPTIEIAESIENFSPSDMGLYSLGKEGILEK